jgi:early secretory antigenic target protein ESAT-6
MFVFGWAKRGGCADKNEVFSILYPNASVRLQAPSPGKKSERLFMSDYTVSPEAIRGVAAQVSAGASEIDAQRATLLAQIQGLGDSWQGTASAALQTLYTQWDTEVRALHDTLTQIGQTMQSAAGTYESTESSVRGSFS